MYKMLVCIDGEWCYDDLSAMKTLFNMVTNIQVSEHQYPFLMGEFVENLCYIVRILSISVI